VGANRVLAVLACAVLPDVRIRAPVLVPSLMSIALSAVIQPSRRLRVLVLAYASCCLAAGLLLAGPQAPRFHGARAGAAACLLAALLAGGSGRATPRRIDISGPGEIRLLVQHSMGAGREAPVLHALSACTVWPALMLLVLHETGTGRRTVLAILPDSLSPGQFRKLAVALRLISARND
jgi:toxin CptA